LGGLGAAADESEPHEDPGEGDGVDGDQTQRGDGIGRTGAEAKAHGEADEQRHE